MRAFLFLFLLFPVIELAVLIQVGSAIGVLPTLLLALCVALLLTADWNRARPWINERVSEATGRPFAIRGDVIHGDKRGRTIGVPTANIDLGDYMRPAYGVYAIRARLPDGRMFDGVASLGVRPMYALETPLLEAWLFDFDGDLYGQALDIQLIAWLRGEQTFDGLDTLKAQIDRDAAAARAVLSA